LPDSLWKGAGNGTPFFYVPGMNGVEFLPAAVARNIAHDRRWFDGLQHPGVDGREPPGRTIAAIALELIRQIRAVQPQGPYALGGFCHGGLVAYEIAHQLEAQGETVAALVLWDTFPHRCWRARSGGEALAVLRQRLFRPGASTFVSDRLRFAWHRLALGCELAGRWIRAGLPGERGRIQARVHLAGMRARARYGPRPFHGRVLLVRSRDERVFRTKLPQDGWAGAMLGPCEIVDVPHWHFDLLQEPAVSELAERTAEFLRRADDV
jgi:thioesterase domain-containing protein